MTRTLIIISVILLLLWVLILHSNVSKQIKSAVTGFIIASPIPPIP